MNRQGQGGSGDSAKSLMDAIKKGEITMTPSWYFTLRTVFFIGSIVLLLGLSIYFFSLTLFIVNGNALQILPWLGMPGIVLFATSLPWFLIILSIALVILLELCSTQLRIVYRRPLMYSSLTLLVLVIAGASFISQTTLHDRLLALSEGSRLPLSKTYRAYVIRNPEHMNIGIVQSLKKEDFVLINRRGDKVQVHITPTTRKPKNFVLREGLLVVVIGEGEDTITATGLHSLRDEKRLLPLFRKGADY